MFWTLLLFSTSEASANCDAEIKQLFRVANSVSVQIDTAALAAAGEPLKVTWSLASPPVKLKSKIYLMVAIPDTVRFEGTGFVLYPGGIEGPAGISYDADGMRAVAPLHVPGNPSAGSYQIKPYREGPFELSWSVVAATKCGEMRLTEPKTFKTTVESTRGSIVVHDLYDFTVAKSVIGSMDGRYRLLNFDGFYQVFEKSSGAKIVDRKGYCADFSPTARFVAALAWQGEDGECNLNTSGMNAPELEVVDLLTGELVARAYSPVLWAYGDAYLVIPPKWWKRSQPLGHVLSLLVDDDAPDGLAKPLIETNETYTFAFRLADGLIMSTIGLAYNVADGELSPPVDEFGDPNQADSAAYEKFLRFIPGGGKEVAIFDDRQMRLSHLRFLDQTEEFFEGVPAESVEKVVKRSPRHVESSTLQVELSQSDDDSGAIVAAGAARGAVSIAPARTSGDRVAGLASELLETSFRSADAVETIGGNNLRLMMEIDALDLTDDEKQDRFFGRSSETRAQIISRATADAGDVATTLFEQPIGCFPQGDRLKNVLVGGWRYEAEGRVVWLIHASCQAMGTVGNATNQLDLIVSDQGSASHYNLAMDDGLYSAAVPLVAQMEQAEDAAEEDVDIVEEPVEKEGDEEAEVPPPDYGRLASAATGQPTRIGSEMQLELNFDDLTPGFVSGRFIVLPVGDQLYVIDHKSLTLTDPIQLAATSLGARFLTTADNRNVLQINDDGSLSIHALSDGRQKLRGRYVDDELVLFDEAGYFTSTRDGSRFVNLRFRGRSQIYSLAQLSSVLARPDRIRAALGANDTTETPQLRPPPVLAAGLDRAGGALSIDVSATAGLSQIRLFEDGVLAQTLPLKDHNWQGSIKLDARARARWATVIAYDEAGFESQAASFRLDTQAQDGGRLFALAVGTDRYSKANELPALRFAGSDARKFIAASKELQGRSFASVIAPDPIVDDVDMVASLRRQLDDFASRSTPRDTIMLFFAGHGLQSSDGRYYLATPDSSFNDLDGTALSWSDLAEAVADIKGRVFIFVDACHSGGVNDANDGAVDDILRGAGRSVAVIAASKGRQFSFETAAQGGGYFTAALTEAMASGGELDIDKSGLVELDELYLGLKRSVVRATGGQQTPWIARSQIVGKMPVF